MIFCARATAALVGRAQWKINQPPSLKRSRASVEGSFVLIKRECSMRAVKDRLAAPDEG